MKPDTHDHRHMEGLPTRKTDAMSAPGELDRRHMLKLMGASVALSMGVAGCDRKPVRNIVSRVDPPEYMNPGVPLHYSSTWTDGGFPYGMIVKTLDGRPVAVEGDPDDPVNRGAASAAMKASILGLYDPDRLRAPRRGGEDQSWEDADAAIVAALRGSGRTILMTRSTLGPAERALVARLRALKPKTVHLVHETVSDRERREAWATIAGADGEIVPRYDAARVILSLGSDFLGTDGPVLEATRQFVATRNVDAPGNRMSRLWVTEGAMTLTGMNADQRIPLRPSLFLPLVRALTRAVAGDGKELETFALDRGLASGLVAALARDLREQRGAALVVAGPHLPAPVHGAVALLNEAIEAPGRTLMWNPAPPALPVTSPTAVTAAFKDGADLLLMLGVNPVYDFPGRDFTELLGRVKLKVGHGLCPDETLAACDWALPSAHGLESWNDVAPRPGTWRICQPVLRPLFESRQEAESLFAWCKALAPEDAELAACEDWYDFIKGRWTREVLAADGDPKAAWDAALRKGGFSRDVAAVPPKIDRGRASQLMAMALPKGEGLELLCVPHGSLHDGRFAGNAWLQELPDPVSRLVWDTAAAISPATAEAEGLSEGDLVEVRAATGKVTFPVLVQPGTAAGVVVLGMGGGRRAGGQVSPGVGANAAQIADQRFATLERVGGGHQLVRTQSHFSMEGRPLALDGTLAEFRKDPAFVAGRVHVPEPAPVHEEFTFEGAHWGMSIDLNACTGCSALRDRLPGREQHPGGRQGGVRQRTRDALDPHRSLPRGRLRQSHVTPCSRCSASTATTLPARWSAR